MRKVSLDASWRGDAFNDISEALEEFADNYEDVLFADCGDDERGEALNDLIGKLAMDIIAYFEYMVCPRCDVEEADA